MPALYFPQKKKKENPFAKGKHSLCLLIPSGMTGKSDRTCVDLFSSLDSINSNMFHQADMTSMACLSSQMSRQNGHFYCGWTFCFLRHGVSHTHLARALARASRMPARTLPNPRPSPAFFTAHPSPSSGGTGRIKDRKASKALPSPFPRYPLPACCLRMHYLHFCAHFYASTAPRILMMTFTKTKMERWIKTWYGNAW